MANRKPVTFNDVELLAFLVAFLIVEVMMFFWWR